MKKNVTYLFLIAFLIVGTELIQAAPTRDEKWSDQLFAMAAALGGTPVELGEVSEGAGASSAAGLVTECDDELEPPSEALMQVGDACAIISSGVTGAVGIIALCEWLCAQAAATY